MANSVVLSLVLLCAVFYSASACSVPPGGCSAAKCKALSGLVGQVTASTWTTFKQLGTFYGTWNSVQWPNQTATRSIKGGPWIGYEVYPSVEDNFFLPSPAAVKVSTLPGCCSLCAATPGCAQYQFFEAPKYYNIRTQPFNSFAQYQPKGSYVNGQQCYLLTGGSVTGTYPKPGPDNNGPYGTSFSGAHSIQIAAPNKYFPPSFVGGTCNPSSSVLDDPHFVGAKGTHFDFNGAIGKTFVLVSDEGLNLNIKLGGYETEETFGATVQEDGKALRTWIEEIGLTWVGGDGKKHSSVLVARKGKQQAVGEGYLAQVLIDGQNVAVPTPHGEAVAQAGVSLSHLGVAKKGIYDLEMFQLKVEDKLEARLHMRVAHAKLQTSDEAHAHFNIHITNLKPTDKVHGILGQTYRSSSSQNLKALKFSTLGSMLGNPIKADGESGNGFLDGKVDDYVTSGIIAEDSKYSSPLM
jgi:hypothetical protein